MHLEKRWRRGSSVALYLRVLHTRCSDETNERDPKNCSKISGALPTWTTSDIYWTFSNCPLMPGRFVKITINRLFLHITISTTIIADWFYLTHKCKRLLFIAFNIITLNSNLSTAIDVIPRFDSKGWIMSKSIICINCKWILNSTKTIFLQLLYNELVNYSAHNLFETLMICILLS